MHHFGWKRDVPDARDLILGQPAVRKMLTSLGPRDREPAEAHAIDLREYFPSITEADTFVSSSVSSCLALVEYFQRRALGELGAHSSLFVHQVAAYLAGNGADDHKLDLRSTLKALVRFGAPPLQLLPPLPGDLMRSELSPVLFGYSDRFSSMKYGRVVEDGADGSDALERVKACLAAGFPVVFGIAIPNDVPPSADIQFRPAYDSVGAGAAVVAVGYDDHRVRSAVGALRIRGCWGPRWGKRGYGWLPYHFVEHRLAVDFWTVFKKDWLASGELRQPYHIPRDE